MFLFTDLEGSTRRREEQPEAMRAALAVHDALLRQAIEGHRGHVGEHRLRDLQSSVHVFQVEAPGRATYPARFPRSSAGRRRSRPCPTWFAALPW